MNLTSACPILLNCLNNATSTTIANTIAEASQRFVMEGGWSKVTDIAAPILIMGLGVGQSVLSWWNMKALKPRLPEQELLISEDEAQSLHQEETFVLRSIEGGESQQDGYEGDIELKVLSDSSTQDAEGKTLQKIAQDYGINQNSESCGLNPSTSLGINIVGLSVLGFGNLIGTVTDQSYSSFMIEGKNILDKYEHRLNVSSGCSIEINSHQTFNETAKYFLESLNGVYQGEAERLNRIVVDFVSSSGTAKIAVGAIAMIFAATVFTCDVMITGRKGQRKYNWLAGASFTLGAALVTLGIYQYMQASNVFVGKNMMAGWNNCTAGYPKADWVD